MRQFRQFCSVSLVRVFVSMAGSMILLLLCFPSAFCRDYFFPSLPTPQYHIVLLLLSSLIVLRSWSFCLACPSFPRLRSYVVLLLCSVLAALAGLESTKSVYSNSWSQTPVAPGRPHHHHHRLCFSHQTLPEHSRVPAIVKQSCSHCQSGPSTVFCLFLQLLMLQSIALNTRFFHHI